MERSTVQQPPPCSSSSSSPAGAVSTRQEAREEGDSSRRGREAAPQDRAPLSQQRRLRQATQFLHKDSADLLPLDSLKRLGTSKDLNGSIKGPCPFQSPGVLYGSCLGHQPPEHPLAPSLLGALAFQAPFFHLGEAEGIGQEEGNNKEEQPHSVIQRRLVEGNQSRLQGESPLAQARIHGQEGRRKTSKTEIPALLVNCKCRDQELQVAVDTGTQHNQISAGCLNRLGLGKKVLKAPGGGLAPGPPLQVEQLELQLGQETVACSAQVVDVESPELCLGLQTLLSLKCCIDLERGVLRLRAPFPELPFLPLYQEPGQ